MAQNRGFADWVAALASAAVQVGDDVPIVQGGVSKRAAAGQAGGLATLDADGKLMQPRRVLDALVANGSTSSPSTTAAVGSYILPDPKLAYTFTAGQKALLIAAVNAYVDVAGGRAYSRLMAYDGADWSPIGTYGMYTSSAANEMGELVMTTIFTAASSIRYTFGISIGNPSGSDNTITAVSVYRSLVLIPVEV